MTRRRVERIKQQMLREAVAENVAILRGQIPSRSRLRASLWRSLALVLLPAAVIAAPFLVQTAPPPAPAAVATQVAAVVPGAVAPAAPESLRSEFEAPRAVDPAIFPLALRRVVIDPGHGGKDPGTAPTMALMEKQLTWDIARRLQAKLEDEGFEVLLTRDGDEFVSLQQRAERANRFNGDVFISIHLNWIAASREVRGIETYYLGATSDPKLKQLAAAENDHSGYSLADMKKLLEGVYADVRQDESRKLADNVQRALYSHLNAVSPGLENWGIKRAPFLVLVATGMPAILAEVSCVSNEGEARRLLDGAYRDEIAEALRRGVRSYAANRTASLTKG